MEYVFVRRSWLIIKQRERLLWYSKLYKLGSYIINYFFILPENVSPGSNSFSHLLILLAVLLIATKTRNYNGCSCKFTFFVIHRWTKGDELSSTNYTTKNSKESDELLVSCYNLFLSFSFHLSIKYPKLFIKKILSWIWQKLHTFCASWQTILITKMSNSFFSWKSFLKKRGSFFPWVTKNALDYYHIILT